MSRYRVEADLDFASPDFAWLVDRVGVAATPHFKMIAAYDSAGRIRGAVGFDHWTPNSVQMHFAMESPIAIRALIRPAFSYAFEHGGKGLALGIIRSNNRASLWTAEHMGFRESHRIKDGHSLGVDLVLIEMRKDECRWLSPEIRRAA